MKILVINGANLNMLGLRETDVYGKKTLNDLNAYCEECGKECGVEVESFQSNYEGELIARIQTARGIFGALIVNAGAYTHTSVAILDALRGAALPTVEVHLTNILEREEFRRVSYDSLYAEKIVKVKGFAGYRDAIEYLAQNYRNVNV